MLDRKGWWRTVKLGLCNPILFLGVSMDDGRKKSAFALEAQIENLPHQVHPPSLWQT